MGPQVVLEVVVVTFAEELEEAEDGASEVGVVEILLAGAVASRAQVLRFVRPLESVKIQYAGRWGGYMMLS